MKYGLIGEKLSHSYSKIIHEKIADYSYELYSVAPNELEKFMSGDFSGINVTIPYKKAVIPYCDTLSETAKAIGSVNTVIRDKDGLHGYNTDCFGLKYTAKRSGIDLNGKKVIIFGSGGTSLTARHVALTNGADEIITVSRSGKDNYENLYLHNDAQILINTTPVGMFPENGKQLVTLSQFPKCEGVIDVIYNPLRTFLVQEALERSLPASGGLPMLAAQAVKASSLFTGSETDENVIEDIISQLERGLTNIILIGMPGSGKSYTATRLSKRLRREHLDTDSMILSEYSMTSAEIYARFGSGRLREIEENIVMKAGKLTGKVISTGSGAVLTEKCVRALKQNGKLIYLMRDCDKLYSGGQPLLMGSSAVRELYSKRDPIYKACCDAAVSNNGSIIDTLKELQNIL